MGIMKSKAALLGLGMMAAMAQNVTLDVPTGKRYSRALNGAGCVKSELTPKQKKARAATKRQRKARRVNNLNK